ncbi:hypothetical protein AB5J62_40775 [Amycolatopsis sp. cg5]|uniref:hypothetical protein n=1 Tax=Amycolatopsis sp. cg5 TaxID=3238802 RepID=UPI0035255775
MERQRAGGGCLIAGIIGLVALIPVIFVVSAISVMASDGCFTPYDKPICDPVRQALVGYVPFGAVLAGLLLAAIGGGWAMRRHSTPVWWVSAAYALVVLASFTACGLATAKPSQHDRERADAYRAAQAVQRAAENIQEMKALPNLEDMVARYGKLREQLERDVAVAVPGIRWPRLYEGDGAPCRMPGLDPRRMSSDSRATATMSPGASGAMFTADQVKALDAAIRPAAAAAGLAGPALELPYGADRVGSALYARIELVGPHRERLLLIVAHLTDITVEFSTPCFLPAAQH